MGGAFGKPIRSLLALLTFFTMGHSVTLFVGSYNLTSIPSSWIEFLIPLTIVITASMNLMNAKSELKKISPFHFFLVLSFGFIHGMGFAGDLRSLLALSDSILLPLLSMNLGLEIGQIIIVALIWFLSFLCLDFAKWQVGDMRKYLSLFALIGGLYFTLLHLPING
jgi:hypothetical protein